MTSACPSCGCEQGAGLLCAAETGRLERDLGDVAAIVADLDISLSKQARIGNSSGPGGLARERTPINVGAMQVADNLGNVLTTWARDVVSEHLSAPTPPAPSVHAAFALLRHIDAIRRHPAVDELMDEITDAIAQARRIVDRPADRQYLGQCMVEFEGVACTEEVYARQGAGHTTCKVCGITHDVAERQLALLAEAHDRLFTVQEAAQVIGSFGERPITESTIRNYISKGQIGYHGKVGGKSVIRLGDLLIVIAENAAKPRGRKLRRAS